jgi:outer membrane protein TolC
MKINKKSGLIFSLCLTLLAGTTYAQEKPYKLNLNQAIELGMKNHQQLKISRANVAVSEQQIEVTKLNQLPTLTASASAFYLGDAMVLNTNLSKVQKVDMPNFGNTYAVQASQLLYKGGLIKKSIEMSELQNQLSQLDLTKDEQSVKFLIISNYLDIYKIINQEQVLQQNKKLAEERLANVTKLYEEDMVTRNEVIRAELTIKNLEQSILTMKNNHEILSNQMSYALGLPNDVLIIPTENIDKKVVLQLGEYMSIAHQLNPALQSAEKRVDITEKNIDIIKTDRSPALAAFGGYNMQRPLTSSTPVMDLFSNTWQAGVSLTYNIDNLFKTKKKVKLGERQSEVAKEALEYTNQNIEIGVNAAYVKYEESLKQAILMEESKRLANENYHIVEAKYLNQLAITAEMTDATNAKLEAELQNANAEINVQFQYYNLLKSAGTL